MVDSNCDENELLLSVLMLPNSPNGKPVGDNFGFRSVNIYIVHYECKTSKYSATSFMNEFRSHSTYF